MVEAQKAVVRSHVDAAARHRSRSSHHEPALTRRRCRRRTLLAELMSGPSEPLRPDRTLIPTCGRAARATDPANARARPERSRAGQGSATTCRSIEDLSLVRAGGWWLPRRAHGAIAPPTSACRARTRTPPHRLRLVLRDSSQWCGPSAGPISWRISPVPSPATAMNRRASSTASAWLFTWTIA